MDDKESAVNCGGGGACVSSRGIVACSLELPKSTEN